jgi:hypothetical protein
LGLFGEQATDQIKCRIIIWAKLLWGLASTSMHITHPRRVTGRPLQFLYVTRMCISNLVLTIKIIMIIILVRKTTLELGSICPWYTKIYLFLHTTQKMSAFREISLWALIMSRCTHQFFVQYFLISWTMFNFF